MMSEKIDNNVINEHCNDVDMSTAINPGVSLIATPGFVVDKVISGDVKCIVNDSRDVNSITTCDMTIPVDITSQNHLIITDNSFAIHQQSSTMLTSDNKTDSVDSKPISNISKCILPLNTDDKCTNNSVNTLNLNGKPSLQLVADSLTQLEKQIIRQIEHYFGDYNLPKDKFLQEEVKKNNGWVAMDVMKRFQRLGALSTDSKVIMTALAKSTSGLMQMDIVNDCIRRNPTIPLPETPRDIQNLFKDRTVYVKGFPKTEKLDNIMQYAEQAGQVDHIYMRYVLPPRNNKAEFTKTDKAQSSTQNAEKTDLVEPIAIVERLPRIKEFKGSVFITYKVKDDAAKFLEMPETGKFCDKPIISRMWQEDYYKSKQRGSKRAAYSSETGGGKDDKNKLVVPVKRVAGVLDMGWIRSHMTVGAIMRLSNLQFPEGTMESAVVNKLKNLFREVLGRNDAIAYIDFLGNKSVDVRFREGFADKFMQKLEVFLGRKSIFDAKSIVEAANSQKDNQQNVEQTSESKSSVKDEIMKNDAELKSTDSIVTVDSSSETAKNVEKSVNESEVSAPTVTDAVIHDNETNSITASISESDASKTEKKETVAESKSQDTEKFSKQDEHWIKVFEFRVLSGQEEEDAWKRILTERESRRNVRDNDHQQRGGGRSGNGHRGGRGSHRGGGGGERGRGGGNRGNHRGNNRNDGVNKRRQEYDSNQLQEASSKRKKFTYDDDED